jgi:hypothetical protein
MIDKLDFLIENKKEIDTAFLEMMEKLKPLFTEPNKKDNPKRLSIAINEYEKVKCKNCSGQE